MAGKQPKDPPQDAPLQHLAFQCDEFPVTGLCRWTLVSGAALGRMVFTMYERRIRPYSALRLLPPLTYGQRHEQP